MALAVILASASTAAKGDGASDRFDADAVAKALEDPGSHQPAALPPAALGILRQKIAACWMPPPGKGVSGFAVSFELTPDGELASKPFVDEKIGTTKEQHLLEASGVRAILRCAPYKELVGAAPYETWKFVTINFTR
ncbi:hypothetical protein [Jiella mangrovi]|uniref:TonB C-terminal domain-containing protein n=1 Tax=Jiella mangrovi TaxID=2821407 RepID=A0ABS4BNC2_9HYPH|nr:hypothetical protein [Jiella mangrovi]MBP0618240.1 hypothetical protein [Jiella mangrovi]